MKINKKLNKISRQEINSLLVYHNFVKLFKLRIEFFEQLSFMIYSIKLNICKTLFSEQIFDLIFVSLLSCG